MPTKKNYSILAETVRWCHFMCQKEPRCKYFVFKPNGKHNVACALFSEGTVIVDEEATSGPKKCWINSIKQE